MVKPKTFAEQVAAIKRGPPKTRRGRPATSEEQVRLYSVGAGRKHLRFVLSRPVVEKLIWLRDSKLIPLTGRGSHLLNPPRVFINGDESWRMPMVLLRIEPPTFSPQGRKLIHEGKKSKNDRWVVSCPAAKCGVIDGVPPTLLDLLWDEKNKGIWLILPDALMRKADTLKQTREEILEQAREGEAA